MTKLKIDNTHSKVGLDEIKGLKEAMVDVTSLVVDHLKLSVYWNDELSFQPTEYRSRDGFMPYSSNHGGIELSIVIPKCEEYNFSFLEFGEYSERESGMTDEEYYDSISSEDDDGHLDANLRIWLKFEGVDENGTMSFYLVMSGGNNDAPYFREKYMLVLFEDSFEADSIPHFRRKAVQSIKKLIKVMK